MTNKTILNFLIAAEVVAMIFAGAVFSIIHPKVLAALFAGGMFILLGLAILLIGLFRSGLRRTFMFPLGMVHLFVISIPMLGIRIFNYGTEFSELRVWGIPGPLFHHVSEIIYLALMVATIVDRLRLRDKKPVFSSRN